MAEEENKLEQNTMTHMYENARTELCMLIYISLEVGKLGNWGKEKVGKKKLFKKIK